MQTLVVKKQTIEPIIDSIAAKMDSACFNSWISPLKFELCDDTLVLTAQNRFSADYILSVYGGLLRSVASDFGLRLDVCVCGTGVKSEPVANDNNVQSFSPMSVASDEVAFDSFIAGTDENVFVLSACKKVAAGLVNFSPLFIYGPAGCGKSLLLSAVESASFGRTINMSDGQFVSEFTRSLHDRTIFAFKDYCRNCDTFIMDDVQALSGKNATCAEFVQLLLDLRAAGRNIVLSANTAPNGLTGFDMNIRSLLASGLVANIDAPDCDTRRAILMRSGVDSDVAAELAGSVAADGHLVSGVATKIKTYSELMGKKVDVATARHILSDTLQKNRTPIAMVRSMCTRLGVSYDAVCGTGRSRGLVLARQMMMAVLKGATGLSLAEIGCYVGNRNHASVLYALSQIEKSAVTDLVLSSQISQMISEYK